MKVLQNKQQQKGLFLLIFVFFLALAVTAYLLKYANALQLKAAQDAKTMQALGKAKQALIAFAVSHPTHPGQMPFPDRNKDFSGANAVYDGKSDCIPPNYVDPVTEIYGYSVLLGRLPIYGQSNPCVAPQVGLGGEFMDADGNVLWYAVSRNLVHKYETYPVIYDANSIVTNDYPINPSVIDGAEYDWLKVVDANGALLSDKVAVVIMAPGKALSGQNRTISAGPSAFLDSFTIGAQNFSNANYLTANQIFVMGQDSQTISTFDNRFVQPYQFNDKLVYVTIEELISALNNRAATEGINLLKQYKAKTGEFPYAAELGAAFNGNKSLLPNQQGSLPIDVTDTCKCDTFQSCTCSFKPIASVTFTKNSGTWQTSTLGCTIFGKKCTCTAAGSCARGGINFSCDSFGKCTTNQTGVNVFTYNIPSYADASPDVVGNAGCYLVGGNPTCDSEGKFSIGLKEASWFKDNLWQDYFYYEWSPTSSLQAGNKTGLGALLIATGKPISTPPYAEKYISIAPYVASTGAQTRPSLTLSNYLDSPENTDDDFVFEATNKQKTSNYNDQVFVVSP